MLNRYRVPRGNGVRVDDAYEEGMEIPIFYDPMIAKLTVHAEDRASAIKKALSAIDSYEISGVKTTLDFGKYVLKHDAFVSGDFDTNFVKHYFSDPAVMFASFKNENQAMNASIDDIWSQLVKNKNKNNASRSISSAWKLKN